MLAAKLPHATVTTVVVVVAREQQSLASSPVPRLGDVATNSANHLCHRIPPPTVAAVTEVPRHRERITEDLRWTVAENPYTRKRTETEDEEGTVPTHPAPTPHGGKLPSFPVDPNDVVAQEANGNRDARGEFPTAAKFKGGSDQRGKEKLVVLKIVTGSHGVDERKELEKCHWPGTSYLSPESSSSSSSSLSSFHSLLLSTPPVDPALGTVQLKSALRSSNNNNINNNNSHIKRQTPRSHEKHVRGLWQEDATTNRCALLHDTLLFHIFSLNYLDMEDLCRCQGVSRRWRAMASREEVWKHVDATTFVQTAFAHFAAAPSNNINNNGVDPAEATTLALAAKLQTHAPVSLTIRSIAHRLRANSFAVPCLKRLQSLTLAGFTELNDTHVHVLFLSAKSSLTGNVGGLSDGPGGVRRARHGPTATLALSVLKLEECPGLTNACLRSIAWHCDQLRELSLRGCHHVNDLTALQKLWKQQPTVAPLLSPRERSLGSLPRPPLAMPATLRSESMGGGGGHMNSRFSPPLPATTTTSPGQTLGLGALFVAPSPQSPTTLLSSCGSPSSTTRLGTAMAVTTVTTPRLSGLSSLFAPPQQNANGASSNVSPILWTTPPTTSAAVSLPQVSSAKDLASLFDRPLSTPLNKPVDEEATFGMASPSPSTLGGSTPIEGWSPSISKCLPTATHSGGAARPQSVAKEGRDLCLMDCSDTGVTGDSLVRALAVATRNNGGGSSTRLHLESLVLRGTCGESFNDTHMEELAELIDSVQLRWFDISYGSDANHAASTAAGAGTGITDAGLQALFAPPTTTYDSGSQQPRSPLQLEQLGLRGHRKLTRLTIANIVKTSMFAEVKAEWEEHSVSHENDGTL